MCGGESQSQKDDEAAQQAEAAELKSEQEQAFGANQSILSQLTAAAAPILAAGPSQEGYTTAEKNNLNTQATESTATGYAAANRDLKENEAAEGGGNSSLPSGAAVSAAGDLESKAVNQETSLKSNILTNDYAQGNQNYQSAAAGLLGAATAENPVGYGADTTSALSGAASTADEIQKNSDSMWKSVISGLGGVGGAAVQGLSNVDWGGVGDGLGDAAGDVADTGGYGDE